MELSIIFVAFALVFFRLASFMKFALVFFPGETPSLIKGIVVLVFSWAIFPLIDLTYMPMEISYFAIIVLVLFEVLIGATMGFITSLCFQFVAMAGQMLDMQMGMSMGAMYDPSLGDQSTPMGRMFYWIALILFIVLGGHYVLVEAFVQSYELVQIGEYAITDGGFAYFMQVFVNLFVLGFKIVLPIMLILLLCDISLGLISRSVPQLNVMMLGLPFKMLVGLTIVAAALPVLAQYIVKLFEDLPIILENIWAFVPVIPIFILSDSSSGEKTEEATPKKKREARKEGQVVKSKEVGLVLTLIAVILMINLLGSEVGFRLSEIVKTYIGGVGTILVNEDTLFSLQASITVSVLSLVLMVIVPVMIVGIIANVLQTRFLFTTKPLEPKLSKLNPIQGFKRIFSMKTIVTLVKDILIVIVVGYVLYSIISSRLEELIKLGFIPVDSILLYFQDLIVKIFTNIAVILLVVAILDYGFEFYKHNKDLKMSKQDIKDEMKQSEGDPMIKSKRRQIQREMAMNRMMQDVPDATVVVTNPTHIAVALKYEKGQMGAPMLVAKGGDNVAVKIKEIAKEHDVPVIENKTLARLVFKEVEIGHEIPSDMYQAVAEVLAMVLKLKKKKRK